MGELRIAGVSKKNGEGLGMVWRERARAGQCGAAR